MSYQLIAEFQIGSPARSLSAITAEDNSGEITIYCGSQDALLHKLIFNPTTGSLDPSEQPISHNHWVVSTLSMRDPGSPLAVVTGCQDGVIRLFDATGEKIGALEGHSKGVISLCRAGEGQILSGSWDGTAKLWDLRLQLCIRTFGPHENGVHVLYRSEELLATVSTGEAVDGRPANFQLRFFNLQTGDELYSVRDHGGSIRSIASTVSGFVTSSNDGSIIMRSHDGSMLNQLFHLPQADTSDSPFILDCCELSNGDIVSVGEDGSTAIWRDAQLLQSFQHPACAWCVIALSNGDCAIGCHDGAVRIFSCDQGRTLTESALMLQTLFESSVEEATRKKSKGPTADEIASLTRWEDRGSHFASSEGFVKLFNKSGTAIAAQWSQISKVWIEVGEVTGSGDSDTINGVAYDHVLPVEIETSSGLRTLQLGYNNGENPFVAAQRFVDSNGLNQSYLSEIADWILARSGKPAAPTFDMSHSEPLVGLPKAVNPSQPSKKFSYLPMEYYVAYDEVPSGISTKVFAKLEEIFAALPESQKPSDVDVAHLKSLLMVLSETSRYHVSLIEELHTEAFFSLFEGAESLNNRSLMFPLFDILRMVATHPTGDVALTRFKSRRSDVSPNFYVSKALLAVIGDEPASVNTTITALRFLVNCFRSEQLRAETREILISSTEPALSSLREKFLSSLGPLGSSTSKLVRSSVASYVLNTAVLLNPKSATLPESAKVNIYKVMFASAHNMLLTEKESTDTIFRSCQMLGSVCSSDSSVVKAYLADDISILKGIIDAIKEQWRTKLGEKFECLNEALASISSTLM